jgi:hypothetical protein
MASRANSIREFGQVGDIFEITNDAQKGGSFASIFVPLGTLVKAPAAAAKGMRAAKTVDAVADTTKVADAAADANKASNAADTASDVTKTPEPKGPNGNGGKIKATPRMKQHTPKCFKPGKALKKHLKSALKMIQKKWRKSFTNNLRHRKMASIR